MRVRRERQEGMIDLEHVGLMTTDFRPPQLRHQSIGRPILQDISLHLAGPQVVGLVGATGAGKSSLLKLLNRLVDPSQGQLYWQGRPYGKLPVQALRHQIMLVPQEPRLLGMTVAESIVYGLKLRGQRAEQLTAAAVRWQERLQIPADWCGQTEVGLSLGQRQWVAIARGIACEPTVLLLDEPMAHLDRQYGDRLNHILRQLMTGLTQLIVIASHDLSWLATICDRVLYLQQGKLAADVDAPDCDWQALGQSLQTEAAMLAEEWS